ncbi:type II toxin-antitoxin system RatA family toxin [Chitinimonas sp.]|uniref:type II toxin-antitoxin system RatA family toxin n=1 Tax=Chitinimonas sp. TaxID=1934313 RepID=UPI0035B1A99D
MPQVHKSVLLGHSAGKMFELIDRVEDYPRFLPWCGGTEVHLRDAEWTIATIGIDYLGLKTGFTTENRKQPGLISLELKDGPFRSLTGAWRFVALDESACKVAFELDYEFSSKTLEAMIGPVFSKITGSFVDAFVKEADRRYG